MNTETDRTRPSKPKCIKTTAPKNKRKMYLLLSGSANGKWMRTNRHTKSEFFFTRPFLSSPERKVLCLSFLVSFLISLKSPQILFLSFLLFFFLSFSFFLLLSLFLSSSSSPTMSPKQKRICCVVHTSTNCERKHYHVGRAVP